MKVHSLIQGSAEWLAYRAQHFNASDAPAMMGCSPYKTRAELLRELHTGVAAEVDIGTQKRFDNGHRAEALARPIAERILEEDLYPVTGSEGRLSASFDGLTLDESFVFEHKALNDELRAVFKAIYDHAPDDCGWLRLPRYHRVQMEQQLHVSGARCALFMASEWTADGELVEEHHVFYYPDDALRGEILAGWAQFEKDLAAYVPAPRPEPVVVEPVEHLPAVAVRMDGALVVQSNLPAFGLALREFVDRVPKRPSTDTEFAQTEAACKALKRAEEALDAAEANALASLEDVNAMRRMVADFRDLARATRLASEKMVDRRKLEVREEAVAAARRALDAHIATLNGELAPFRVPLPVADFAGAIKGKRSISSMQDALDGVLTVAKIAAEADARGIRANVATFQREAAGLEFLFADLGAIVHKAADDFAAVLSSRIATHKAAEAAREAKRKADEEARIQAEAARLAAQQVEDARVAALAAQREQDAAAESVRVAAAVPASAPASAAPAAPMTAAPIRAVLAAPAAPASKAAPEPATLRLGDICTRIGQGFTMTAAFVSETLGVSPQPVGALKLYRESDFARICSAMQTHVAKVYEAQREAVEA